MASSREYLEFVLDQLSDLDDISYKAMMGEYIIYYREKIVGGVYDDRFLVKPVKSAKEMMPEAESELPYEGAKEMLLVDNIDSKAFLKELLEAMYCELPAPKKKKKYIIRSLRKNETELLKDFLYEAIFIPEGMEAPEKDIVEKPELRVYIDDFGSRRGDNCLVADFGGKVVGAVWTRIMNDYGHLDDDTPSFAISLYKEYRGQGIGSQMMVKMLELLKRQGYERASLAVQKANYAVKMYRNIGFKTIGENAEEYIMVYDL